MPNRMLHESICCSESLASLWDTPRAEQLFFRLVVLADDYGAFDGRVPVIRARAFQLLVDVITEAEIEAWLGILETHKMVARYVVDGAPYVQILGWPRRQKLRHLTRRYPPFTGGTTAVSSQEVGIYNWCDNDTPPLPGVDTSATASPNGLADYSEYNGNAQNCTVDTSATLGSQGAEKTSVDASRKNVGLSRVEVEVKRREDTTYGASAPSPVLAFVLAWNALGFRECKALTPDRRRKLTARLREHDLTFYQQEIFPRMLRSSFLHGGGDKGWVADFDFILRANTVVKILEGKYDDRHTSGGMGELKPRLAPTIADAVKAQGGGWQDIPEDEK